MLTLYHAPMSRSGRIIWLLEELGAEAEIVTVSITRQGRPDGPDPRNPHPDGKVPALVHDGALITESPAIILYLTDFFPDAGLGPRIGEKSRGPYLTWLAYYGDVMEPAFTLAWCGLADNPMLWANFRGTAEINTRLVGTLEQTPYLLGDRFSAADLLIASPFAMFPDSLPDNAAARDWLERCTTRPAYKAALSRDGALD